jgi:hypothetical protein
MGIPRTIGAVAVGALPPTPVYHGPIIPAVSFSILNGIATIVLNVAGLTPPAFPTNGYNGPNGYPLPLNLGNNGQFDIHGGINVANAGSGGPAGGQQVTLWGFTTATYFNGRTVTVLDCNPALNSFRFYFNNANVASTADAGNTATSPFQHYRVVRLECSQTLGTDIIYVGDLNVSSTRYFAALSLAGQFSIEVASENIPADRIWITGTGPTDSVQVSLIY